MELDAMLRAPLARLEEFKDPRQLYEILSLVHVFIDNERTSMQIYKEGSKDPLSILRFYGRVNDLKKKLLAHQMDFEEEIARREREIHVALNPAFADGFQFDPLPLPEPDYEELHKREAALLYEKEELMSLPANAPSDRRLEEIDEELGRIESVREKSRRKSKLEDDLKDLDDARNAFRGIIKKFTLMSENAAEFLRDTPYSIYKEKENGGMDLRFADIVDVVYDLFKDMFIDGLTKWQLLLAMNCQGEPISIIKPDNLLNAAVLVHTIAHTYADADMPDYWKTVLPRFGLSMDYYSDRGSEKSKLSKLMKARVKDLEAYIKGLNKLKQKLEE